MDVPTNSGFIDLLKGVIEKHIPSGLIDPEYCENVLNAVCSKKTFSRWEIIFVAYSVGADRKETDSLLIHMGYDPLYVKRWEDAICFFALSQRPDLTDIVDIAFRKRRTNSIQKEDEF